MKKDPIIIQRLGYGLDAIMWALVFVLLFFTIRLDRRVYKYHEYVKQNIELLAEARFKKCK